MHFPRKIDVLPLLCSFVLCSFASAFSQADEKPDPDKVFTGKTAEAVQAQVEKNVQHVVAKYDKGRFAAWPATHGVWIWGNEILTGYSYGYHKDLGPLRHNIDRDKPETHHLLRSLDGGLTWKEENPNEEGIMVPSGQTLHGKTHPDHKEKEWKVCPGGIDFTHPDFCMTIRMTNHHVGPSRFYYSYDRGHHWEGPFQFPQLGTPGIAARTDYIVEDSSTCMVFLTAGKPNGEEGRPLCARTTDGGKTWNFVGWIAPEPKGYAIMPTTVRLRPDEFFSAIRCKDESGAWLDTYRTVDHGKTWNLVSRPVPDMGEGNPGSMIMLKDGRICLSYGIRKQPSSICSRLSSDGGKTWSREYVLRNDGSGRDIGYPRSVQRPDGKVVVLYYFFTAPNPERYIAATIWDPPSAQ